MADEEEDKHPSVDKPWLFKPGQSGNPTGRSKAFAEMVAQAQEYSPKIVVMLFEMAMDINQKPTDRITAGRELLDRAWGRPAQQAELTINEPPSGDGINRPDRVSRADWIRNVIQDKQKAIEVEEVKDVDTTTRTTTTPH